jgi:hypothetical protein
MIFEGTINRYIQQLEATIWNCTSINRDDRTDIPRQRFAHGSTCLIRRGFSGGRMGSWSDSSPMRPFRLIHGGELSLYLRIRQVGTRSHPRVEVDAYRMEVVDLGKNPSGIDALRYDKPEGLPKGPGWDDDLQDNRQHPHCHLHLNFRVEGANDLRLPTGHVSPLLLLAAFDHWYYSTYHPSNA